jgi:7-carboxy-7-deazaguanine synthase
MSDLRLVEHYVSVQGEGPRVGALTQFVRFAGCNMRCPLWPCDTQHAIDPSIWRTNSYKRSGIDLAAEIANIAYETGALNICLTGGEPFMQDNMALYDTISALAHPSGRYSFEVFTNGSFPFPVWSKEPMIDMLYTMDWKLPGSGEESHNISTRNVNATAFLTPTDGIKFVVVDKNDLDEARRISTSLRKSGFLGTFWVGAAWDRISNQEIISYMIKWKLKWKLNVQVHKYIWHPDMQGV